MKKTQKKLQSENFNIDKTDKELSKGTNGYTSEPPKKIQLIMTLDTEEKLYAHGLKHVQIRYLPKYKVLHYLSIFHASLCSVL